MVLNFDYCFLWDRDVRESVANVIESREHTGW